MTIFNLGKTIQLPMLEIRKKMYYHFLKYPDKFTINNVCCFILQYRKTIVKATLYSEYLKISKLLNKRKIFIKKTILPSDVISKILIEF